MTLLERPAEAPARTRTGPIRDLPGTLRRVLREHRWTLITLVPLLIGAVVLQGYNMFGAPQRIDDEGTYAAQAYAVLNFGELAHYTYWYDHPPLGWLQLAAYAGLTGAFERASSAVMAGREFMLLAHALSCVLLWVLARRTGLARWAAALAVVLFTVSPLALEYHRFVYLDNIATVWLLLAFVLASTPKARLLAFVGSAAAFSIAVLTKETYLLLLPVLVWLIWAHAPRGIRNYALTLAATVVVLFGFGYVLFALVNGEFMPTGGRVSLWDGILFQLAGREGSGSLLDGESPAAVTIGLWLNLDPVLPTLGVIAAVAGLFVRVLRPYAVGLLFLLVFMVRPGGYLPVPYVIAMLPLAALLIAGVAHAAIDHRRQVAPPPPGRKRRTVLGFTAVRLVAGSRPLAPVVAACGLVATLVAVPAWAPGLRSSVVADLDAPMRDASSWLADNIDPVNRVMVDNAQWVDLYTAGFPRDNVVWYYKVDTDPAVRSEAPNGWRDYDFVVTTGSLRTDTSEFPLVSEALENSRSIAEFGSGSNRVTVNQIVLDETVDHEAERAADLTAQGRVGSQLADNPAVNVSASAETALRAGEVDSRLLSVLPLVAAGHELSVLDFPRHPAEPATEPRRTVRLTFDSPGAEAEATETITRLLDQQRALFQPLSVERSTDHVDITYSAPSPLGVLPRQS